MGDGNTSSYRWQPDRKLTYREQAIYCQQHHAQLQSRCNWLEEQNQKLALANVALNRELAKHSGLIRFIVGDEVKHEPRG